MDPLLATPSSATQPKTIEQSYGNRSLRYTFQTQGLFLTLHDSATGALLEKLSLKDRNLELLTPKEAAQKIHTLGLSNCTVVLRQNVANQTEAYLLPLLQGAMDKEPPSREESLLREKDRYIQELEATLQKEKVEKGIALLHQRRHQDRDLQIEELENELALLREEHQVSKEELTLSYEEKRSIKSRSSSPRVPQDDVKLLVASKSILQRETSPTSSPHTSQVFAPEEKSAFNQVSSSRSSKVATPPARKKRSSLTAESAPPPSIGENTLIQKKLQNPQLELALEESITLLTQCIYYGKIEAQKTLGQDAVIFIGNTGAGKSTTVNYLCGCTMQLKSPKELGMKGIGKMVVVKSPAEGGVLKEVMPIGHTKESKTFMPQIETHNLTYCDCPGFLDNRGAEINIANAVNIKHAIAQAKSVTVIMLINYHSLKADRARGLTEMLKISCNLFGKAENLIKHQESILIGISNAPLDMDLSELKEWIAEDATSLMQTLADRIFIFDPLDRPLEGGWDRTELLSRIQSLRPITDQARIFSTVLTDEDEHKLIRISEEIGLRIQEALRLKDFSQAASHFHRLEELRIIDHITIERLVTTNRQKIQRQFQDEINEFRTHCHFERFSQAEEILTQLQKALEYFDEEFEEYLRLPTLHAYYQDSKNKYLEAKRKEQEYQRQLLEAQKQIQQFLALLESQKQEAEKQIQLQQQSFAQAMREMEATIRQTASEYESLKQTLRREMEIRLAKKEEELHTAQGQNLHETQAKLEQERAKLSTEYTQKLQEIEKERSRVIQEQQSLKQKAEQDLNQEQARLQQKIQELEKAKQEKLAQQEKQEMIGQTQVLASRYQSNVPQMAFGKKAWEQYLGEVGDEPPLPSNIQEILDTTCPVSSGLFSRKKIKETHLLVLVPQTVNGKPLTLNYLKALIQSPKGGGNKTDYRHYYSEVQKEHGDTPASASHWILMTKDVIAGTRNKPYEQQCSKLRKLSTASGVDYEVPPVLEASVAILTEYVRSGERHYSGDPCTYTRCQETVCEGQWRVVIGGFAASGLYVYYSLGDNDLIGLGSLRKGFDF